MKGQNVLKSGLFQLTISNINPVTVKMTLQVGIQKRVETLVKANVSKQSSALMSFKNNWPLVSVHIYKLWTLWLDKKLQARLKFGRFKFTPQHVYHSINFFFLQVGSGDLGCTKLMCSISNKLKAIICFVFLQNPFSYPKKIVKNKQVCNDKQQMLPEQVVCIQRKSWYSTPYLPLFLCCRPFQVFFAVSN